MKPVWKASLSVAVLALGALPALAQPVISAKSGVVSYVTGKVMVGDEVVKPSETKFTEVKENAVLRTEEGKAEVLLISGTTLRTGENSSFKMLTTRLIDTRVELLTGTHIVEVTEILKDNNLTLAVKDATVVITKRGLYRFDVDQSRIKVFEGVLGVTVNGQSTLVGAGKMLDTATAKVEKFDKEATDAMDHWAQRRAELVATANVSSAKQQHDYGCPPNSNFAAVNNSTSTNPCSNTCGSWQYNPWYRIITWVPCGTNIYSPYGYRYYNPYNVMRVYYQPPPIFNNGGGFGGNGGSYSAMGQTSAGYSGAMSTSTSSVSSSTAAVSSGTSVSSSAGSASSGGGASGGGRGK
jgi:FecR protein